MSLSRGLANLRRLASNLEPYYPLLQDCINSNEVDTKRLLSILYELLLDPQHTIVVARCFPKLIVQIFSENVVLQNTTDKIFSIDEFQTHLKICIALSKLLPWHPDVFQFCLHYFDVSPSPFEWSLRTESEPKRRKSNTDINDVEIVECCYRFLNTAPNVFCKKWNWSVFIHHFITSDDNNIKWLVCQCIAKLTGMSEHRSKQLAGTIVKNCSSIDNSTLKYMDGWQNEKFTPCSVNFDENSDFNLNLLSDYVVDVAGVLLPVHDNTNREKGNLVNVKSTLDNLRSLALAIVSGKAVCLVGPVGCGKTALVEHLAHVTGRKHKYLKKVQLGDQTDSRSLLGTYRCTDIPGEFIWQPGILTQAVQRGYWLLLEDIDSAPMDVVTLLSSLLERNVLSVPGYRDAIPITSGFQLFLTKRTVASFKMTSNITNILENHWIKINIEPLSRSELIMVVDSLFPTLKTISSRMIDVFMLFSVGSHQSSLQNLENEPRHPLTKTLSIENLNILLIKSGRLTSTRDLIKWCTRAIIDFDVSSPESALKVLQDALDIFACSLPTNESRLSLAVIIGAFLGIVETKAEYFCTLYKPLISFMPNVLHVGRASVERKQLQLSSIHLNEKRVVFSYTRPSLCLLERIAFCVKMNEPVLLVGETGTGKTSCIQFLAKETGNKLIVINMNQQSDSADLLGGYKPVDLKYIITPIRNEFEYLFRKFYNENKNVKFLEHISNCFNESKWDYLINLMKHSQKAAMSHLQKKNSVDFITEHENAKFNSHAMRNSWYQFGKKLEKLELQIKSEISLAFSFIEGSLVKAIEEGYWVLLDEINLASSETLECLSGLLEGQNNSISLIERGDDYPINRHKNFTLFACMNPATDVGKRDLPAGLRNRFTEFFIDELSDKNDLLLLISDYLKDLTIETSIIESIYKFYMLVKKESQFNLIDGTGQSPHYSLRTLCRALAAVPNAYCGTVPRSLYETLCLSFLTQLDSTSHPKVQNMIASAVLGKRSLKSVVKQPIPMPKSDKSEIFLNFEGYWIRQGDLKPNIPDDYILTPSVRRNLRDIVRIISLGKLPILLQGDTSVGKTSLITYLAKASGNYCVRINNHQHTDLQEYIGMYTTDTSGKLIFREGVLVEAMRKGYWIILDELNLAPSDVLEALNRVLDDNRELFIPETQQVVKADSRFILFATQNPPGLYGGRKLLSRAFKNRFVELHFDEIPRNELEIILNQRCHMPLSYCKKVLSVMTELQIRRKGSAAVQGKEGFITLRDLFRWGQRYKIASNRETLLGQYYDWEQHIADEGYLVLAGRVRQEDERLIIQEVLEKHIKRKVDPHNLFSLHSNTSNVTRHILEEILDANVGKFSNIVWTLNMRKLAVLISKAFLFKEPVLLVGETGCGKTTVCQVLAEIRKCNFVSVNCHMHTESSDFLGGLRPVRHYNNDGKLFEWVDGPLVETMNSGGIFLSDEISLADDSVLERLNSLLEPEREILLAEKGINMEDNLAHIVKAKDDFRFIGTMNPGGDYGKKELSPALRNRFTEIWCEHITSREDISLVLKKSLQETIAKYHEHFDVVSCILDFTEWFKSTKLGERFPCNIRDLLSWIHFINEVVVHHSIDLYNAYFHGANLVFLDSLGSSLSGSENELEIKNTKKEALQFLNNQVKKKCNVNPVQFSFENVGYAQTIDHKFGIPPFFIQCRNQSDNNLNVANNQKDPNYYINRHFNFKAPTSGLNTLRILRGLQLNKPILLEGSPGVGKTSLVTAIARTSHHKILRINLSDQTDISDLFGADLPNSDGSFSWKEGAFLNALKNGDWILLDELNLAPQPVLEGLNACLDHRGEIFVPELGKTFSVKMGTKIFACQNPLYQGGARRGLPKSFLNRFTQVYIDTLTSEDLFFIMNSPYNKFVLPMIIKFNSRVSAEISSHMWGLRGGPWEMNLRDIERWCDGMRMDSHSKYKFQVGKMAELLYINRMRTKEDRQRMITIYNEIFGENYPLSNENPTLHITEDTIYIGTVKLERNMSKINKNIQTNKNLVILRSQLPVLQSLMQCVQMNWLAILVGPATSGKSSCIQLLSQLVGVELKTLSVTSALDTADLLGGFEQMDYNRHLEELSIKVETLILTCAQNLMLSNKSIDSTHLIEEWEKFKYLYHSENNNENQTMTAEMENYKNKLNQLQKILVCLKNIDVKDWYWYNDHIMLKNELSSIEEKLDAIKAVAEKEKITNASGKFEWVDSLLIKCLLDGSWLLIDNVNLCSAAVLDRLNCLLEPCGVLTIPERGELSCEIKPHPNFRMFFTMDPKNGEISRAMRNRGVEIYIMGLEDCGNTSLTDSIPFLDLQALLFSANLPIEYHKIFLSNHKLMCSFIEAYEKPTHCHLLQAAFLTCQQLYRGVCLSRAIIDSFSDIYIKSRVTHSFAVSGTSIAEQKNNMWRALIENVEIFLREMNQTKNTLSDIPLRHTFNSLSLTRSTFLERIQQDSFLLHLALVHNKHYAEKCLNVDLAFSIFNFYHLSSFVDVHLRNQCAKRSISHILKNNISTQCLDLSDKLYKVVVNFIHHQLDIDPRDQRIESEIDFFKVDTKTNELCTYLYYLSNRAQRCVPTDDNIMRIIDYSENVLGRRMRDDYVDSPLLKQCTSILKGMDKALVTVLEHPNTIISSSKYCDMILSINWLNRFQRALCLPLFQQITIGNVKMNVVKEDTVKTLMLHYKWLLKFLLNNIMSVNTKKVECKFIELIHTINWSIIQSKSPLKSISKNLNKVLGQPPLCSSANVYESCIKRDKFVTSSASSNFALKSFSMDDIKCAPIQNQCLDILNFDCLFGSPSEDFMNKLKSIEQNLITYKSQTKDNVEVVNCFTHCAQLWPIEDFVIKKILNLYKLKLSSGLLHIVKNDKSVWEGDSILNNDMYDNLMKQLFYAAGEVNFVPLKIKCLLSKNMSSKSNSMDNFIDLSQHSMEIWRLLSEYEEHSPSISSAYWLNWNTDMLDPENIYTIKEKELLPVNMPYLTHCTVNLILKNEGGDELISDMCESTLSLTPLSKWKKRSEQLATLHSLIWRNMITVAAPIFCYDFLNAQTILKNYERMTIGLAKTLLRKKNEDDSLANLIVERDIKNIVNMCTEHINALYGSENEKFTFEMVNLKNKLNSYLDESVDLYYRLKEKIEVTNKSLKDIQNTEDAEFSALVGRLWSVFGLCSVFIFSDIKIVDIVKKYKLRMDYMQEDLKILESLLDIKVLNGIVQGNVAVTHKELISIFSSRGMDEMVVIMDDNHSVDERSCIDKSVFYEKIKNKHSLNSYLIEKWGSVKNTLDKRSNETIYRTVDPSYNDLLKELDYFKSSIGDYRTLDNHYHDMVKVYKELSQRLCNRSVGTTTAIQSTHDVITKYYTWSLSIKKFCSRISNKFSQAFPEVVNPFLNSITQFMYGLNVLKDCMMKLVTLIKCETFTQIPINRLVEDLTRFPILNQEFNNELCIVNMLLSEKFRNLLNKNILFSNKDIKLNKKIYCNLLKISLQELYCSVITSAVVSPKSWDLLYSICNEIIALWQDEQKSIEKKKQEEDSIYIDKTKPNESGGKEIDAELLEIFPSFIDVDFSDFKINSLSDTDETSSVHSKKEKVDYFITDNDVETVISIHSNVVTNYCHAEWLRLPAKNNLSCDYLSPLVERYKIFKMLENDICHALNESVDSKLAPSLMIMVAFARCYVDGENHLEVSNNILHKNDKPRFYHSPWVQESRKCLPILKEVQSKTLSLLEQWPDFPTLNDILKVIDRIMNFSITSPVARFLTGLELLRDKIEDWNRNAHKNNNMNDLALTVAQQIVQWRKLELSNWRDSLNSTFKRLESEGNKWWFHLYVLVDTYINEKPSSNDLSDKKGSVIGSQEFISVIKEFIEKSSLVDFNKRLNLLYVFHCHASYFQPSYRRDDVLSILWNLYNYYSQFSSQISEIIKAKRAPVEKKLKDYIKICTWERDLSYWAVKELVFKSHKTLHKHIKEFEEILRSGIYNFMSFNKFDVKINNSVKFGNRPKRSNTVSPYQYVTDMQNFVISPRTQKKYICKEGKTTDNVFNDNVPLLKKLDSLTLKSKELCKTVFTTLKYPQLIQLMDDMTTNIINTIQYLSALEVSPNLSEDKKKSQIKHQLQQKRKGLSELFQCLSTLGVSYKTGLMENTTKKGEIVNFKMPPVNLEAAFEYLKDKRCDTTLLTIWEGCELYYQGCIAKLTYLNNLLLNPSPDLGPQNIERIKGYAIHYMLLIQEQKLQIVRNSRKLGNLRHQIIKLTELCDSSKPLPEQINLIAYYERLNNIYTTIIMTIQQFDLLMKAYPTASDKDICDKSQVCFDLAITNNPLSRTFKDEALWNSVNDKMKQIMNMATKQKDYLRNLTLTLPNKFTYKTKYSYSHIVNFYQPQLDVMDIALMTLNDIQKSLKILISDFNLNIADQTSVYFHNPIAESLVCLDNHISLTLKDLNQYFTEDRDENMNLKFIPSVDEFHTEMENFVSYVLFMVQEVYKHSTTPKNENIKTDNSNNISEDEDDPGFDILKNHLSVELQKNINTNMSHLHLSQLNFKLNNLILILNDVIEENSESHVGKHVARCIPLLEQVVLTAQYFFTQQVSTFRVSCKMLSIILNIFTDLSQRGFCLPQDVKNEEGKGEGNLKGGTGLADGEGEKDVSDQIENQDQLDDALRPNEERENEKKEYKEEENGIEMTDDFESHLHDVEKNEEFDEESDDEDVQKEMGEAENKSDRLDQQIWGSDEEENEPDKRDSNEKGSGTATGEKQLEAKEDDNDGEEEGNNDNDERKKKKNKDINEINEPEYDEDQVDPYHGNQQPLPEPEPLEMPDNTNIDDRDDDHEGDTEEKNPFEIDVMKDKTPKDVPKEQKSNEDEKSAEKQKQDASEGMDDDSETDENKDETETSKAEKNLEDKEELKDEKVDQTEQTEQNAEDEDNKDEDASAPQIPDRDITADGEENEDKNEEVPVNEDLSHPDKTPSAEDNIEGSAMDSKYKDTVQINPDVEEDKKAAPFEQSQEHEGDDEKGYGQSECDQNQDGHMGSKKNKPQPSSDASDNKKRSEKRNKPSTTDEERILGEIKEPVKKKMKALNVNEEEEKDEVDEDEGIAEDKEQNESDIYQHIKHVDKNDSQIIDAATKEQAEKQNIPNKLDDENKDFENNDDYIDMDKSDDEIDDDPVKSIESEQFKSNEKKEKSKDKNTNKNKHGEEASGDTGIELEGENVPTFNVQRGNETVYHTKLDMIHSSYTTFEKSNSLTTLPPEKFNVSAESSRTWHSLWGRTSSQARLLTEKLRLVLEPTGLSRLAGDYRTGRRINMRRVIPYIASHFRKDRIWLRRTRPAKREYHIAVAIDDSSSMCDNQSKELAFESLALISQSLNLLETGDFAVLSYGETTKVLHPFSEQFTENSGSKLIQNLTFAQTKTRIANMLEFSLTMFNELCSTSNAPNAKLLLIVSDGRSIFCEGEDKVMRAVRRAQQNRIFTVYIIIDNPNNQVSIMDIRTPVFNKENQLKCIQPYLDTFPFPFYLILRDLMMLPSVLSDAMRQWFELASNMDKH